MKKFLFAFILVGTLATFSSCKKTYTCECVSTSSGTSTTQTTTITDTKTKATEACDKGDGTATSGPLTVTTACSIK